MAYRENCVLVNDEDTDHCESNRFSAQSTQKHVHLQRATHARRLNAGFILSTRGVAGERGPWVRTPSHDQMK